MDEQRFLGKKISRFNRKAKSKLISVPSYPIGLFHRPIPRHKLSTTQRLISKAFPENLETIYIDSDVTLTQEREKYIILIIAESESDAEEKYSIIARTTGKGSTSPTHPLLQDFQICLQEEVIIIRGCLETLRIAIKHLHTLKYISDKKKNALCEHISQIEDADSETESSDSASERSKSDTEVRDLKFLQ